MGRAYAQFWTLSGRSGRKEFWKWQAITTVVPLVVFAAEAAVRYRRTGSLGPLSDRFGNRDSQSMADFAADPAVDSQGGHDTAGSDDPWGDITGDDGAPAGHGTADSAWADPVNVADSAEPRRGGFDPLNSESPEDAEDFDIEMMKAYPVTAAATLVMAIPAVASSVRRLHDVDKSGWHLAWSVIPVIGWPIFAILARGKGTDGPNRFGPASTD